MKFEQNWKGRNCTKEPEVYFDVSVPGNIQYDYGVAHGFENVQFADNYKQYLPLENDDWEYETHLCYEKKRGSAFSLSAKESITDTIYR